MSNTVFKHELICRFVFSAVFLLNITCAFGFILFPENFAASYELSGGAGFAAVRGMGVAFLMWNATYPLFIFKPFRHISLGFIIAVQQLLGCIGETFVFTQISQSHEILRSSIIRFLEFDLAGLVLMLASLVLLVMPTRDKDDIQECQL